jgi:hypothetical protein
MGLRGDRMGQGLMTCPLVVLEKDYLLLERAQSWHAIDVCTNCREAIS